MKDELKRTRKKEFYYKTAGTRMAINAAGFLCLYVIEGIACYAGKKVLAAFALGGMLGVVIMQTVDGIVVQKHNNK